MENYKNKYEIRESSDYSIFNLKNDNRDIFKNHIEKIANDMKNRGFAPSKSIQVDSNYNIIDGQHRFLAAKKIGIPVLYIVDDSMDFLSANNNQRKIITRDYVKYYAVNGNQNFVKLIETCKKYNIDTSRGCYLYTTKMIGSKLIQKEKFKFVDLSDFEIDEMTKYYLSHFNFIKSKNIKPTQLATNKNVLFIFNIFYRSKMFRMEDFENNFHTQYKGFKWDNGFSFLVKEFLKVYNFHKSTYKVTYANFMKKNPENLKKENT